MVYEKIGDYRLNGRYYPRQEELSFLNKKLQEYFSFPQMRYKRNQIAFETSKLLHPYSQR